MTYEILIIGGGPAGITAGIFSARQKLNTLLITKQFGGQMAKKTVDVENYPGFPRISGLDLIKKFEEHLKGIEVKVERDNVIGVKKAKDIFLVLTESKKEFKAKAIIIASGADARTLNVSGEKKYIGKGISYCPMCDGPLFRNKKVAVVGGGNAGFETAVWLSKYTKEVLILERGLKPEADTVNQEIAKRIKKIKVITGVEIKEIKGNNFADSIVYKKNNKEEVLKIDGIFIEIGYDPASSFVKNLVDLNKEGEIKVNPDTGETKTKGLFAAGDVDKGKCKQIVVACGEAAVAATSAYKYLQNLEL